MKKQLSAIALLAGTAIGSGMLSLPLVLARYGLVFSCILMISFIWVAYYSSIIRAELNINSREDYSLKDVGKYYSGIIASRIGSVSLKLLSYSLIAAYLHGLASLTKVFVNIDTSYVICGISVIVMTLLYFSNSLISRINKILFMFLISAFIVVTFGLLVKSDVSVMNIPETQGLTIKSIAIALPIIFTSFGFQGSIHSLTKFVNNDETLIRRACLWGSVIPAIVYVCWLCCTLLIIYNTDVNLFNRIVAGNVDISEMVEGLTGITHISYLKAMFWTISLFAILTSIIGVGLAIFDEWNMKFDKIKSSMLTMIPSTILAVFVPNAFIRILDMAGMILLILAIFLPVYLYRKMQIVTHLNVNRKFGLVAITMIGIILFIAGIIGIM